MNYERNVAFRGKLCAISQKFDIIFKKFKSLYFNYGECFNKICQTELIQQK